jgi:hypothetical protein
MSLLQRSTRAYLWQHFRLGLFVMWNYIRFLLDGRRPISNGR